MEGRYRLRRGFVVLILLGIAGFVLSGQPEIRASWSERPTAAPTAIENSSKNEPTIVPDSARSALETLAVKGRAPKTGYSRAQFGDGWRKVDGCDMRNIILARDMDDEAVDERCKVTRGTLRDPYTGMTIAFVRGETSSDDVQIDHVVALSNAWQTGAQQLTASERDDLANDPLELLAVDGMVNQAKSDGDAATWLPPYKAFRCQYVARQIAVKQKYRLWVTEPEKQAMLRVLDTCPDELLPSK